MSRHPSRLVPVIVRPHIIAAILMVIFGLGFICLLRPLNTPDEASHFMRAYEISEGKLFASQHTQGGCLTESGTMSYATTGRETSLPKSVASFITLNWNTYVLSKQFTIPLNPGDITTVCERAGVANSPIGYLPQSLAIFILRLFNAPPVVMDYLARLFVLTVWTVLVAAAIKIMPVRKWALVAVALLPISIQQSISMGTDPLSIAPVVLFMAILVRSYFEDRSKLIRRDLAYLTLLAAIATLSKPVMVVLGIALLFYNANNNHKIIIGGRAISYVKLLKASAICMPILFYGLWSVLASVHGASSDDIFMFAAEKTALLKASPLGYMKLLAVQTLHYIFGSGFSFDEFGSFGWFTSSIPQSWKFWGIIGLGLALLVGYKEARKPLKNVTRRAIYCFNIATLVTALGIVAANVFVLFTIWTPLNAPSVQGVQFRYLIPAFFVLASLVEIRFLRSSEKWYRNFVLINASMFFIVSMLTLLRNG